MKRTLMDSEETKPPVSFIEQIIIDDLKAGEKRRQNSYKVPSRTKRLSPYRPCKSHLSRFRNGSEIRW